MPKFIFVIGSSGTGKSTVSCELENIIRERRLTAATLNLDHYYLPKSMIDSSKPANFDIPAALDEKLIRKHLEDLEAGKTIRRPTYDMITNDRVVDGEVDFHSQDVIIVEGIFAAEYIRDLRKNTERFKILVQSPQIPQNYSRKEDRDKNERQKTDAHIKAMKRNQIGCLFQYIAPHMNTSDMVIENSWQPTVGKKVAMIVYGKLHILMSFLNGEYTTVPSHTP